MKPKRCTDLKDELLAMFSSSVADNEKLFGKLKKPSGTCLVTFISEQCRLSYGDADMLTQT